MLSWNQLQVLFSGQGLVFWLAVTAIAIGLTLLSVSIVWQVKKVFAGINLPKLQRPAAFKSKTTAAQLAVQVTETETGYRAHGLITAPPQRAPKPDPAEAIMSQLLQRLQSSTARLEEIHSSLDDSPFLPSVGYQSVLKVSSEDVDYLYKSERS